MLSKQNKEQTEILTFLVINNLIDIILRRLSEFKKTFRKHAKHCHTNQRIILIFETTSNSTTQV
jgi:transposase-like protein